MNCRLAVSASTITFLLAADFVGIPDFSTDLGRCLSRQSVLATRSPSSGR